jgi:hypothetical protein
VREPQLIAPKCAPTNARGHQSTPFLKTIIFGEAARRVRVGQKVDI